ncbi:hypothetical protein MF6394_00520 [Pseudomonas sp. MF6394]|nr:hypothetical protein MF6394_00520 [Pseudomonas sp. MF6394]
MRYRSTLPGQLALHSGSRLPDVTARCKESRKIGFTLMVYADAWWLMGKRYRTDDSLEFAPRVMTLVKSAARDTSVLLASERGS